MELGRKDGSASVTDSGAVDVLARGGLVLEPVRESLFQEVSKEEWESERLGSCMKEDPVGVCRKLQKHPSMLGRICTFFHYIKRYLLLEKKERERKTHSSDETHFRGKALSCNEQGKNHCLHLETLLSPTLGVSLSRAAISRTNRQP